jgi:hypothetical protein
MPRRITPPSESKPVVLTRVKMRTAIARLKQRILELQAFDPTTVVDRDEPRIGILERAIDRALAHSFGAEHRRLSALCHCQASRSGRTFERPYSAAQ